MKFFLFWLGMGLAAIASTLIWAAVGSVQPGKGEALTMLFFGLLMTGAAWLVMLGWANAHRVKV